MKKIFLITSMCYILSGCSLSWLGSSALETPKNPEMAIAAWQSYVADLLEKDLGFFGQIPLRSGQRKIDYRINHPGIRASGVIEGAYRTDMNHPATHWVGTMTNDVETFRPLVPTPFDAQISGSITLGNTGTTTYIHGDNITIEGAQPDQTTFLKKIITPFVGKHVILEAQVLQTVPKIASLISATRAGKTFVLSASQQDYQYDLMVGSPLSDWVGSKCLLTLDPSNFHYFVLTCGQFTWSTMPAKIFLDGTFLGYTLHATKDSLLTKTLYTLSLTDAENSLTTLNIQHSQKDTTHTWSIDGEKTPSDLSWKLTWTESQTPESQILFDFPTNFTTFSDIIETPIQ